MATEENKLPPAGWYDDPEGSGRVKRYWDGRQWTDRYEDQDGVAARKVDEIDRGFKSLYTLATVFTVLGWLTITVGPLLVIAAAIEAGSAEETATTVFGEQQVTDPGASAAVIAIVGTAGVLLYALLFFAAAAFTRLWLRVEDNTFRTAAAIDRLTASRP